MAALCRQHTMKLILATMAIAGPSLFSLAAQAQAQATSAKQASKPGKKTAVDFTDQLVEGKADKPELFYLLQQRNANNKRLIRLRENFLPEMKRSAEDVGRQSRPRGRGN